MNRTSLLVVCVALFFAGCGGGKARHFAEKYGSEGAIWRVDTVAGEGVTYYKEIQPILENRCSACHSCYDAPCQLKFTSFEGMDRGGTQTLVYNSSRISADDPTRLFVDAETTEAWRAKGFHPVLNERLQEPGVNLENSLLILMLRLKRTHPQPSEELLPQVFNLSLAKTNNCVTREDFESFEKRYPLWGMPYALPGLTGAEHDAIVAWARGGGRMMAPEEGPAWHREVIKKWESFLNGNSLREKLVSRYIFEHLFIAHIHFKGFPSREFYRLVRSTTPTGEAVDEIATVRPYDDPGVTDFYYRFKQTPVVVVKDHTVYRLNDAKMARYNELFFQPNYEVSTLPAYTPDVAANPLSAFVELPAKSRYRFLLDNAHFIVNGFIKGPVCRGQVALNVINDHFFLAFFDPERDSISSDSDFLAKMKRSLDLPGELENTLNISSIWFRYSGKQERYLTAKEDYLQALYSDNQGSDISHIWDGDKGTNDNAVLTVFRHFDSATVLKGFVGQVPKTAWVVDFPLLERIHYLLVAGFDVYGNVGHQAVTRLYMDFLRMEGENNFLSFMPSALRMPMRRSWYKGAGAEFKNYLENPLLGLGRETGIVYTTATPKAEFFEKVLAHVGPAVSAEDRINRCSHGDCIDPDDTPAQIQAEEALRRLARIRGTRTRTFPDVTFIRVVTPPDQEDLAYSVIKNKALSNNSFMLGEARRREPQHDTLSIIRGHVGSYPNAFAKVSVEGMGEFVDAWVKVKDEITYYLMARKYFARRTTPTFWDEYDWHCQAFLAAKPVEGGYFDLYRYSRIADKGGQVPTGW